MDYRLVGCLIVLVAAWATDAARAEVRSLTVGIDVDCPYGMPG